MLLHSHFYYWTTPALFVFSFVGGILIFKMMWVTSVFAWSIFNVNYIELFLMNDSDDDTGVHRPNAAYIINHTMDLFIVFMICLIFFYRANSLSFAVHTTWEYIARLVLFSLFIAYILYNLGPKQFHVLGMEYPSINLFGWNVMKRCFSAPFYKVTFIDNFAADALTSFTRIISDSLHAVCWIISGSFLRPNVPADGNYEDFDPQTTDKYGSDRMSCTNDTMTLVVGLFMIIPLWVRFLQCMRNFYDNCDFSKRRFPIYPHSLNGIKYLLSIVVVIYGVFLAELNTFYYFLIVFTTIYKWLWDVFVDWGLFYTLFQKGPVGFWQTPYKDRILLRPNLMYDNPAFYIFAITADLILRFVWVVSLAPASITAKFAKSALQMFMGALEIIRRGIWSMMRVENEHVNKLHGHALGVLIERRGIRDDHSQQIFTKALMRGASTSMQSTKSKASNNVSAIELQLMNDPSVTEDTTMKEASWRLASTASRYLEASQMTDEADDYNDISNGCAFDGLL
jgi:hypothetical protein